MKCGLTSHKVTTIWIALQTGKKYSKYSFLNGDVMIQHSQINKALKIDIGWYDTLKHKIYSCFLSFRLKWVAY